MKRRIVSVEFTNKGLQPRILLDDGTELEALYGVRVRRKAGAGPAVVEVSTYLYDPALLQDEAEETKAPEPPVRLV